MYCDFLLCYKIAFLISVAHRAVGVFLAKLVVNQTSRAQVIFECLRKRHVAPKNSANFFVQPLYAFAFFCHPQDVILNKILLDVALEFLLFDNPFIILPGQAFFHPIERGFFLRDLPAQIGDSHQNGNFQIARIHRHDDSASAGDAVVAVERFPAKSEVAVSGKQNHERHDSVWRVFVDSHESVRVDGFHPSERLYDVFAEARSLRHAVKKVARKNRKLISLAAASHLCHLANSFKFLIQILAVRAGNFRTFGDFFFHRLVDVFRVLKFVERARKFFVIFGKLVKQICDFGEKFALTFGVRLSVRLKARHIFVATKFIDFVFQIAFKRISLIFRHVERVFGSLQSSGIFALQLLQAARFLFRRGRTFFLPNFVRGGRLDFSLPNIFEPFVHIENWLARVVFQNCF